VALNFCQVYIMRKKITLKSYAQKFEPRLSVVSPLTSTLYTRFKMGAITIRQNFIEWQN
jgi:hypothetical protein